MMMDHLYQLQTLRVSPKHHLKSILLGSLACLTLGTGCHPMNWNRSGEIPTISFDDPEDAPHPSILGRSDSKRYRESTGDVNISKRMQDLSNRRAFKDEFSAPIASTNSKLPSIIDTTTPDADLDEELKNLSPAVQALLKKQLEVMEKINEKQVASASLNDNKSETTNTTNKSTVAEKKEEPAPTESLAVATLGKPEFQEIKKPSSVRVSLKDDAEKPEDSAVRTASATSADQQSMEVVNAVASTSSDSLKSWHRSLNETIQQLQKEIEATPVADEQARVNQQAVLRLLFLANGKLDESLEPIDVMSEHEREYFRHQLQALYTAIDPEGVPVKSRRWSLVMNSQQKAETHLSTLSGLEVKSLHFCKHVEGYGVIEKFGSYVFKSEQEVVLYCELENVTAEELKNGFETKLQASYEITDRKGTVIANEILPEFKEICNNRRRDYCVSFLLNLPKEMSPGAFKLKLAMEDMKGHKFGQSTIDFQIGK